MLEEDGKGLARCVLLAGCMQGIVRAHISRPRVFERTE